MRSFLDYAAHDSSYLMIFSRFLLSKATIFVFSVCTLFFLPLSAEAATLYWVGNDGANTSVASNWKTTDPASCGSGNASAAPTTTDTAVFDADCDNGASINTTFTVTSMTLSSGYAGVVTLHAAVTISSTLTQAGGHALLQIFLRHINS